MEHIANYFTLHGSITRKQFLFIFVAFTLFSLIISYAFTYYVQTTEIQTIPQLNKYLAAKSIIALVLTLIWVPAVVKRLHDIGISGVWAVLLLPPLILDFRNIILFKEITNIEFTIPISVLYTEMAITLIFIVALFFTPSNYYSSKYNSPNNAFKRDTEKAPRPLT